MTRCAVLIRSKTWFLHQKAPRSFSWFKLSWRAVRWSWLSKAFLSLKGIALAKFADRSYRPIPEIIGRI
jgi:hypothetical protein